jgi:hypothetical protein
MATDEEITDNYEKSFVQKTPFNFIMNKLDNIQGILDKPFVFGGYPRDLIANTIPTDIDIYVKSSTSSKFIEKIKHSERLLYLKIEKNHNKYESITSSLKIEVPGGKIINVDLVEKVPILSSRTEQTLTSIVKGCNVDFTCNNLMMYGDECIKARVVYDNLTLTETLSLCIKDIHERKLRPMFKLPSKTEYYRLINKIKNKKNCLTYEEFITTKSQKFLARLHKMQKKGYTLVDGISIEEIIKSDIKLPMTIRDIDEPLNCCAICSEEFNEEDGIRSVVCECGHYFHTQCLLKWKYSGRSAGKNCPTCRSLIKFKFN